MSFIASLCVPSLLLCTALILFTAQKDLFSEFTSGVTDGMRTVVGILPTMLLLTVAVRMVSASGVTAFLCRLLSPFCQKLLPDAALLPIVLLRPLSGSGATALLTQLFADTGPDSFASRAACILMGSSDTILYTVSIYFSSVGEKRTGRTVPLALIALTFCTVLSCLLTKVFFK